MYKVYVIFSEKVQKYYTGQTEDITKRLIENNEGTFGRYTKNKGPWVLLYCEEFETWGEALKR
jgi:putative endonuclease